MEKVIVIATCVSAISTLAIAIYSIASYQLAKEIRDLNQQNEGQFSDLLQAIVVSNMTQQSGGAVSVSIENFKKYYQGKTAVFR